MKSDAVNQSWKPTLTLAKLFEEQNQFYDALAIYEIISQTDQSPEIQSKIEFLQTKILNDPNMHYDSRIEKLFSAEELVYLKIMNHSAFENLSRMQQQYAQGASDYEIVLEENELSGNTTVSAYELRRMVEEIDTLAESKEIKAEPETQEQTISDLADELVSHFGKNCKLSSVSVQEFMQVVTMHKFKDKNDKE